ncbi:carbohydrate ABC transporter permease [Ilumatobacter sp.]|uniref:carbohydrate ABC transporter permease n=1 Tax=Ilumatobacter sp. TaxID=1967498 RepID=UPI003AF61F89
MTAVFTSIKQKVQREKAEPILGQNRLVANLLGLLTWIVGLIFFFPLFWMVLNGFKEEAVANASPKLFFDPTLDRFREVTEDNQGLLSFNEAFSNSLWIVSISTLLVIVLAVPAAYALAIRPMKKWRDILFFFISTKFLPIVGAIMPLWIIARDLDLLNTRTILIILYTAMNLPLAVWMLRSFFAEVPRELIEAAQMDGCSLWGQIRQVILPIVAPGLAATALLCVIFAWNEFFLAVQLNPVDGSTMPVWVASQETSRGNFLAKLSAASVLATLPVVIAGWIAQKRMIRGLAMGAIK